MGEGEGKHMSEECAEKKRKRRYYEKLTYHKVLRMRERSRNGDSNKVLAIDFGVSESTVSQVVNYKTWSMCP